VKIIRGKEDYSKFNQGDILVTYATNPNMVPLMKMASAIITDEGGVTCHAAIVSRELGVPCVIGTRFATKILKDGEQVEVFADKGNVMRMKQEEFFMFEQIFGISPLDTISYAWSLEEDLLDRYFVKDLGMKGYPTARLMGVFTGDKADLFYASDIMALGQFMLKKAVADPNWPMFANKDNRNKSSAIFRYADKLLKMDISKLNDEELADLYDEYNELHRRMHESGWFGNILDYDGIFYNHLFELIDKRIKKRGLDLSPQETLQKLTLASDLSFGQKEEIAFLDIVKEAKASGAEAEQVLQMIEQHTQKWFWLSFGFAGHGWRQDHFEDKLKEMVATEFDAQKLKQEILEKPSQIIADKKKLAKMLKLDNSDLKLLKSFADICFLKGYRKDSMFFGNVARFKILKEISKRARVPMNFLRYTLPEETRQIIMTKKADLEDLRQRVNYTVMHFESNKPMKYLWGEEAKKYYESLNIREVEIKEIDELKGMCASVGQAKGRVAIINRPEEMTKINKGDILVSEATMPDLMPAIKKAAAIVTNVGGITCHAAIVSRELGIPCVIGTKIATKALKDGDMIEVDADNGLVKKV